MRIKLTCENCTARLRASSGHTGRRGSCPQCGMTMRVPSMPRRLTPRQRIEQRAANSEQRAKMAPSQSSILDPRSSILVLALAACLVLLTLGLVWITVSRAQSPRIAREQNATIGATQAFAVSPAVAPIPLGRLPQARPCRRHHLPGQPSLSWAVPICRGKRPAWLDNGNSWSTIGNCSAKRPKNEPGGRPNGYRNRNASRKFRSWRRLSRPTKQEGRKRDAEITPGMMGEAASHPRRASRYPWPGEPVGSRSAKDIRHVLNDPPFPEILSGKP